MTAITEQTALEYGVRFTWPGDRVAQTLPCGDLDDVIATMDTLAGQGVTIMEPVSRPGWTIEPAGLPVAIRLLAEARADRQLDDGDVCTRLGELLPGRDADDLHVLWRDLLAAVRDHGNAADAASRARVDAAVRTLLGGRP
jgi:hypothetical protein